MTATAFVIHCKVEGTGKSYILLRQHLQHRQHHGVVGFDLAYPLSKNAGLVVSQCRSVGNPARKRLIHQVMMLDRSVDHHQERG